MAWETKTSRWLTALEQFLEKRQKTIQLWKVTMTPIKIIEPLRIVILSKTPLWSFAATLTL